MKNTPNPGVPKSLDGFAINASDGTRPRALRVFGALIQRLNEAGFTVAVEKDDWRRRTNVERDGYAVHLSLRERTRAWKPEDASRFPSDLRFVPTGDLALAVEYSQGWGGRKWSDRKYSKLEARINELVAGIVALWTDGAEKARGRKEEELRQAESKRQQAIAAERARLKAERLRALLDAAHAWRDAQLLNELANAARRILLTHGPIEPGGKRDRWLRWVHEEALAMDPLVFLHEQLDN